MLNKKVTCELNLVKGLQENIQGLYFIMHIFLDYIELKTCEEDYYGILKC